MSLNYILSSLQLNMAQIKRQNRLEAHFYPHQPALSQIQPMVQKALGIYFGLVNYANNGSQIYVGLGGRVLRGP